jgi:hypothetical protein
VVDVVVVLAFVVFVVVVFDVVVVWVVVTGGVRVVVVFVVVVLVTGATRVTDVVVVTGAAGVTAAAAVVVEELCGAGAFLWRGFLWCTARLWTAAADVELDVVEDDELVDVVGPLEVLEALGSPELPQPTIVKPAMTVSSAAFMHPPAVVPRLVAKANNG